MPVCIGGMVVSTDVRMAVDVAVRMATRMAARPRACLPGCLSALPPSPLPATVLPRPRSLGSQPPFSGLGSHYAPAGVARSNPLWERVRAVAPTWGGEGKVTGGSWQEAHAHPTNVWKIG